MNDTKLESPVVEDKKTEAPSFIAKVFNILQANTLIKSLTEDNKNLMARLDEAQAEVKNLHKMSEDWAPQIESINQLKESHKVQLETQKTDLGKQINELKGQVSTEVNSAQKKAITILANLGVPIDELPPISNNVTNNSPEAKLNTFLAMPAGTEKTAYYNANRVDVIRASNAKAANQ